MASSVAMLHNGAMAWTAETIAEPVRRALELGDTATFGELLSPDVQLGAPDFPAACHNRQQVLKWYEKGRASKASATVTELTVTGDQLLIGLAIISGPDPADALAPERWQVMQVGPDGVKDIRGYEDRHSAAAALTG
jgi:hypothetical protein